MIMQYVIMYCKSKIKNVPRGTLICMGVLEMNKDIKEYIDSLNCENIPWHRMFTAYGTAEDYDELLSVLEQTLDTEEWEETYDAISDFEHQSTMFYPAPFVLVFLVRILEKLLGSKTKSADIIAKKLIDQFTYYAQICSEADEMEHSQPLENFSDMLDDKYLLSEECDEDELEEIFEDPEAIPDDLFYSFYYYSKIVLSQVPEILDKLGKYNDESEAIKELLKN